MSGRKKLLLELPVVAFSCTVCLLVASMAFASEGGAGWRDIYDIVLKWVNFFILAFLFFKFVKNPLRNYFSGQKAELARQIDALEKDKEGKIRDIDEARKGLEGSEERLAALKERIVRRGEVEKEAMVKAAQDQSRLMLENAQRKVAYRIQQAKANFRAELIDTAINTVMKHLPPQMTDADNQRLIQLFLDDPEMAKK